ncbi:MAG: hypothetical protein RJA70_517 [Pseudomonadota bacterium]|jgi:hypothetical protein
MSEAAAPEGVWEVEVGENDRRTLSLDELKDALQQGIVDEYTAARKLGGGNWQPLHTLLSLPPPTSADPDAPTRRRNPIPTKQLRGGGMTVMGLGPGGYGADASATQSAGGPGELRRPLARPGGSARSPRRSHAPGAIPRPGGSVPPPAVTASVPPPAVTASVPPPAGATSAGAPQRRTAPPPLPASRPSVAPPGNARPSRPPPPGVKSTQPPPLPAPPLPSPLSSTRPPPLAEAPRSRDPMRQADLAAQPAQAEQHVVQPSAVAAVLTSPAPRGAESELKTSRNDKLPEAPHNAEWVILIVAALAGFLLCAQRTGWLHDWASGLGLESSYVELENRTLGGSSLETPRGVEEFVKKLRSNVRRRASSEPE